MEIQNSLTAETQRTHRKDIFGLSGGTDKPSSLHFVERAYLIPVARVFVRSSSPDRTKRKRTLCELRLCGENRLGYWMLEVKEINVFRGEAQILWDLGMKVEEGRDCDSPGRQWCREDNLC